MFLEVAGELLDRLKSLRADVVLHALDVALTTAHIRELFAGFAARNYEPPSHEKPTLRALHGKESR